MRVRAPAKRKSLKGAIEALRKLPAFKVRDALSVGIDARTLSRLVEKGVFLRRARGIFLSSEGSNVSDDIAASDFRAACKKFGIKAFITGPSALDYYDLTNTPPSRIWVAVPPSTQSRDRLFRLIRTKEDFSIGVTKKNGYRIASIERALLDALKFSYVLGRPAVFFALRTAITRETTSFEALSRMAKTLGRERLFSRYSDTISPEAFGLE